MEDWNMVAADCIVISCCCQCMILQVLVLILLRLPWKLVRKTKEFAKKKLRKRKREVIRQTDMRPCNDQNLRIHEGSFRIQEQEFLVTECHSFGCCMEEVEKVLEVLAERGEFAFGSFWSGERENVVQYNLIEGLAISAVCNIAL